MTIGGGDFAGPAPKAGVMCVLPPYIAHAPADYFELEWGLGTDALYEAASISYFSVDATGCAP